MQLRISWLIFILTIILGTSYSQNEEGLYIEENQGCIDCHGNTYFYYYNDWFERDVKERMNPYFIIDSTDFYISNHRTFLCIDCHSMDYEDFPHPNELRFEPVYECMDCHEGDENFAEYHFEKINDEFHESVHSSKHSEEFTCWMCHDPHSYKINARTQLPITEVIVYDNDICLSCHANLNKYQLLTSGEHPNIISAHEWLPNQAAHFQHVRCIECHAEYDEEILVAHNIQQKKEAVKLCVECHSSNSILMASLYKYQTQLERSELGFFNPTILSEAYVIGANRNVYLNIASFIIFFGAVLLCIVHFILFKMSQKK